MPTVSMNKTAGVVASLLLLGGCAATLADFQKMDASARADYVCDRHPDVMPVAQDLGEVERLLAETEQGLADGYKTHESCKEVPAIVIVDDCSPAPCLVSTETFYDTVCDSIPVAIDVKHEKEKLKRYQSRQQFLGKKLTREFRKCHNYVAGMDAKSAFDYHRQNRTR